MTQAVALPAPTGSFAVGTRVLHLRDTTRTDPVAGSRGRDLAVQLWYPARRLNGALPAPYLAEPGLLAAMRREGYLNLKPEVLDGWSGIRTHSVPDAPVAPRPERLPLLLFSPGQGVARSTYTSIVEELASHGYAVAAIDHPHAGLTVWQDGRVLSSAADTRGEAADVARVEAMAGDVSFVLDVLLAGMSGAEWLTGRLDRGRVGALGHSIGGAAALEACRTDARILACADMDGHPFGRVEEEGVDRPHLVMLNQPEASRRPPPEVGIQRRDEWAARMTRNRAAAYLVTITDTNHYTFSDAPFVVPEDVMRRNGAAIPPRRGWEIVTRGLRAFFSRHLRGETGESLRDVVAAHPGVTLETFNR
ncbi:MAG TPA: hypothetical protein VHG51_19380 [Longimicrobiaceae bacterium]|nr:hypothetical protein [Longimicrobiaceae bacterium]